MLARRMGFFRLRKKSERRGRGFPPVAINFFSFSFCLRFRVSSSMMQDVSGGSAMVIQLPPGQNQQQNQYSLVNTCPGVLSLAQNFVSYLCLLAVIELAQLLLGSLCSAQLYMKGMPLLNSWLYNKINIDNGSGYKGVGQQKWKTHVNAGFSIQIGFSMRKQTMKYK